MAPVLARNIHRSADEIHVTRGEGHVIRARLSRPCKSPSDAREA